jgi:hypothetical protein
VRNFDIEQEMKSYNEEASLMSGHFSELERKHEFSNIPLNLHIDYDKKSSMSERSNRPNKKRMEKFE